MKRNRVWASLAACLLLAIFATQVFAASVTVDEMNIDLEVPDDYILLTQNTPDDDPAFSYITGETPAQVKERFAQNYIYLNAIDPQNGTELLINQVEDKTTNRYFDLKTLSENKLKAMVDDIVRDQGGDVVYTETGFYDHPQAKFIYLKEKHKVGLTTLYSIHYYTILGGKAVNIYLNSIVGEISEEQEAVATKAMESLTFHDVQQKQTLPQNLLWIAVGGGVGLAIGAVVVLVIAVTRKKKDEGKALAEKKGAPAQEAAPSNEGEAEKPQPEEADALIDPATVMEALGRVGTEEEEPRPTGAMKLPAELKAEEDLKKVKEDIPPTDMPPMQY